MSDELTRLENESIRKFVKFAAMGGYLRGRVLDYGCGRQPYRSIVEAAGGEYTGYDREEFACNRAGDVGELPLGCDSILCTQIMQFVDDVPTLLAQMRNRLTWKGHGHLVLSYTTNWPEVNEEDLHRHTKAGMERLLTEAGFTIIEHVRRATFHQHGYEWAFGYGVIARA